MTTKYLKYVKRSILILLFFSPLFISSQELDQTPFEEILDYLRSNQTWEVQTISSDKKDLQARTQKRDDINGNPCALLKIDIPKLKGVVFEGSIVGPSEYTPGEYLVYVPNGTKRIKLKHEDYAPLTIEFSDFGIKIEQQTVYKLLVSLPRDLSHLSVALDKSIRSKQKVRIESEEKVRMTEIELVGAIEKKYNIHMDFTMDNNGTLKGIYYYDKYAAKKDVNYMTLKGVVNGEKLLVLEEYNKNGKNTGRFEISYRPNKRSYEGKFIRYSDGKEMSCRLNIE